MTFKQRNKQTIDHSTATWLAQLVERQTAVREVQTGPTLGVLK